MNTLDREDRVDVLDRAWLADHGLLRRGEDLDAEALRELAAVREAVRDLLLANNGVPVDRARAAATLDASGARAALVVRVRAGGVAALEPAGEGVEAVTARILGALAALAGTEAWSRLKACRWESCGWAFTDDSRNRSRAWCSMAVCGNRAKARAYRSRH